MYLLFGGWNYYPSGGWEDYLGAHDTLGYAIAAGKSWEEKESLDYTWWHVVNLSTGEIVKESYECESV